MSDLEGSSGGDSSALVSARSTGRRRAQLPENIYQQLIDSIHTVEVPLAYFQSNLIVEQVLASYKFEGIDPQFTPQNTGDVLSDLLIQSTKSKHMGVMR